MPSMDNHDHQDHQVTTGQIEPHASTSVSRTCGEGGAGELVKTTLQAYPVACGEGGAGELVKTTLQAYPAACGEGVP